MVIATHAHTWTVRQYIILDYPASRMILVFFFSDFFQPLGFAIGS